MFRAMAGSALDRVIVPRTANLISVGCPGRLALAAVIAARSDPGPALPSLVTVSVRAWAGEGFRWRAGRVAAMAAVAVAGAGAVALAVAPPAITPDAARPAATKTAPAARTGTRGTKWPLRTIVPRRDRIWVTILNTIIPLPRR